MTTYCPTPGCIGESGHEGSCFKTWNERILSYEVAALRVLLDAAPARARAEGFDAAMRQAARTYWYEKGREVSDRFDQAVARQRQKAGR